MKISITKVVVTFQSRNALEGIGALIMTIAACHVSPEGVVLGADSTTTITNGDAGTACYFDHAQKLFEVGEPGSSLALVTWGMGAIGSMSHRSIAHELGIRCEHNNYTSMAAIAQELAQITGQLYNDEYGRLAEVFRRVLQLYEKGSEVDPADLAIAERAMELRGGYCLAGRAGRNTNCEAFTIEWGPGSVNPLITQVPTEQPMFWGVPEFIERLTFGADSQLAASILESGNWSGTEEELFNLLASRQLIHPRLLPLREAIDWIHTVIHTTIRAIKFAKQPHMCGGPIEIAAITTDRPFRWVMHKELDSAVG